MQVLHTNRERIDMPIRRNVWRKRVYRLSTQNADRFARCVNKIVWGAWHSFISTQIEQTETYNNNENVWKKLHS